MEHIAAERRHAQPPLSETPAFIIAVCLCIFCGAYWLLLTKVYHFTNLQAAEIAAYLISAIAIPGTAAYLYTTRRCRREKLRVHPPLVMSPARDRKIMQKAWENNAVVLGYDIHGEPWLWPDQVRVMQGIVLGMTGSGKTTLLKNIITQDLMRRTGPPEDRHKIPMVIFDGKGDLEFFQELLPHIHRAGRLDDLRLINPSRPDLSSLYNPFYAEDDDYMAQVNMVFGSFNLHDEFFAKHQLNYLADVVRILHYTGSRINFYDVIVAVLDQEVLDEQIQKAREHIQG
ncbi:MAG: FtsK/SpoIIIE domain-containing protein, partial [Bryobacteraceae bacterium]